MGRFKDFLKRFLPLPVNAFHREMTGLRKFIAKKNKAILSGQEGSKERILEALARQQGQIRRIEDQVGEQLRMERQSSEKLAALEKSLDELGVQTHSEFAALERSLDAISEQERSGLETLGRSLDAIGEQGQSGLEKLGKSLDGIDAQGRSELDALDVIRRRIIITSRYASEAVWAETFSSATEGSGWFKNKNLFPGRWAVGYQYLYVVYRVFNEVRPKRILELGLGQSTRLISQYCAAEPDVDYYVVEADPRWKALYEGMYGVPSNCEIVLLDYEMTPYKDVDEVRTYKGFSERFKGQKFDFISIDAPFGADMKRYSRIDVLKLLPDCLSEDFVIVMDDCDRSGEKNTVEEIRSALREAGIPFRTGLYSGHKDCVLIAAERLSYLTTM